MGRAEVSYFSLEPFVILNIERRHTCWRHTFTSWSQIVAVGGEQELVERGVIGEDRRPRWIFAKDECEGFRRYSSRDLGAEGNL